jgi:predicted PolB exonuclease-like 3'-5' exonuclease
MVDGQMPNHIIVWDIETIPDLRGFASANGHDGKNDDEIREAMGESFAPQGKATLHEVCRMMGLPGKPDGMSGAEVEKYYRVKARGNRKPHLTNLVS